jgi:hypothetical protein
MMSSQLLILARYALYSFLVAFCSAVPLWCVLLEPNYSLNGLFLRLRLSRLDPKTR